MSEEITHQFPKDGFDRILARLDSIDSRMAALEEKVERRLMETRPIWEQVLARLDAIETRLGSVETRLDSIESQLVNFAVRLDHVEEELHDLNVKFRVFLKDLVRLQESQQDLTERVQKLESTPTA